MPATRRQFLHRAGAIAAINALPVGCFRSGGANSDVRVAVIGFHGKGMQHIEDLLGMRGVRIVALCDVDGRTRDKGAELLKKHDQVARAHVDFRECCADKEVDAVVIATPNHSHALIAMTALANDKHVYVEKPVSHNLWEGRQLVAAAARRPKLIVQHGLQRRSDPGWAEAIAWAHEGHLGKITLSRGINYKARESIGKVTGPTKIAKYIDYDLWCGPRPVTPLMRKEFYYDWHWQWAYGNGDIGNNGPHHLDVGRWALRQDAHPVRVMSLGARWGYIDDGETPNQQLALFHYGEGRPPLLFDNRGLPMKDMHWGAQPVFKIGGFGCPREGNVIHCEGGFVAESKAYDNEGKAIKKFGFQEGAQHMENWLQSIRDGKPVSDHLSILNGHLSSSLAHLANISYRIGRKLPPAEVRERLQGDKAALETLQDFEANLAANKIEIATENAIVGPWLDFDPATERFTGEFATEANALLTEEYRAGFELPQVG